jgi:hypothetical protein
VYKEKINPTHKRHGVRRKEKTNGESTFIGFEVESNDIYEGREEKKEKTKGS